MGKMKKLLVLTLVAALAAFAFAGCSKTENKKDEENVDTSGGDWEYIAENGKMTIGITYFAPMNFKDDKGELIGFETEFAKAVCEKLGVQSNFIEIEWNSKETELNSKNIDCIWNGMTITEERKANMAISKPYMKNKQVMVVKKGNEEKFATAEGIKGAAVVAEKGSAGEGVVIGNEDMQADEFFKEVNYTAVDAQSKVLLEVKSGTADVGVIDYVMTIGSIGAGTDYEDLVVVDAISFADEEYGIAFRKGSNVTLEKVNAAIDELAADGTLKRIADKYKLGDLLLVK